MLRSYNEWASPRIGGKQAGTFTEEEEEEMKESSISMPMTRRVVLW